MFTIYPVRAARISVCADSYYIPAPNTGATKVKDKVRISYIYRPVRHLSVCDVRQSSR